MKAHYYAILTCLLTGYGADGEEGKVSTPLPPVISHCTGLLLEPPLDLSTYKKEDFLRESATLGREKIDKKWSTAMTPLPPHGERKTPTLTEAEVLAYMRQARQLFDAGQAVPISDAGLISTQEDVVRTPMLNHVSAFANDAALVYLLVQRTIKSDHWGYFAIVQDRAMQPPLNYFADMNGADVKFEAVSCYKCHASGPLAIHPVREDLVNDPALLRAFNQHIADLPLSRMHYPTHDPAPAYGEPLALKACAKCHAEDADRAPLFRAHSHSIRVLVDFGHMPPKRALEAAEIAELKAWLEAKP